MGKLDYIKMKIFCSSKEKLRDPKDKPHGWNRVQQKI